MDNNSVFLVVPTCRPDRIGPWIKRWDQYQNIIVVCDYPDPFDMERRGNLWVYGWNDIEAGLGEDAWIIPRHSDAIRSFGFLKALELGADIIVTIDDDCAGTGVIMGHYDKLSTPHSSPAWQTTMMGGIQPRGMPYHYKERLLSPAVNVGLWAGVPDLDAVTQLMFGRSPVKWSTLEGVAPIGTYIPMCGMNLAFRRTITPLMYFLLMGQDRSGSLYPFDRFGDIWCGVIAKRIMDRHHYAMTFGSPTVNHQRASDKWINLRKEINGLEIHEQFWLNIDNVLLAGIDIYEDYERMAWAVYEFGEIDGRNRAYWKTLGRAMLTWKKLTTDRL